MNYLDVAYIVRLYVEDAGWERVRALAAEAPVGCSLHGYAETIAALHRKFREGTFTVSVYTQLLHQFKTDCDNDAYHWFPVSYRVTERLAKVFMKLPRSVFLRSSDALHLACASANGIRKVYSNDTRVIAAAQYFGIEGIDVLQDERKARP